MFVGEQNGNLTEFQKRRKSLKRDVTQYIMTMTNKNFKPSSGRRIKMQNKEKKKQKNWNKMRRANKNSFSVGDYVE